MIAHRYSLLRYNGLRSRLECPQCHDKRSLAPYVDNETGRIIDKTCGRCNHQDGCGYHMTPSEYFKMNPEEREKYSGTKNNFRPVQVQTEKPLQTIPTEYIKKFFDGYFQSDLAKWLLAIFDPIRTKQVLLLYLVGMLPDKRTIYWQIDKDFRCRGGKIIQYRNGHRVKKGDPSKIGFADVDWMHTKQLKGSLPEGWSMTQCLFGEHLLTPDDNRPVAIVEGEKTAVIMAICKDDFIWLSCGGLEQFSEAKMRSLTGRNVVLFADEGCHQKWEKKKESLSRYARKVTLSSILRDDSNPLHRGWDIGDLMVEEMTDKTSKYPEPLKGFCKLNPAVVDLCETFNLELVTI